MLNDVDQCLLHLDWSWRQLEGGSYRTCSTLSLVIVYLKIWGGLFIATGVPMITLLSVLLATIIPQQLEPLVSSGEGIAAILLSLFFAAVGRICFLWPLRCWLTRLSSDLKDVSRLCFRYFHATSVP